MWLENFIWGENLLIMYYRLYYRLIINDFILLINIVLMVKNEYNSKKINVL